MKLVPEKLKFFPSVSLVLTNSCRMRCKFCCAKSKEQISLCENRVDEIIEVLKNTGVKRIGFSGGEPLFYRDISNILQKCYDYGFENIITTSDGQLLQKLEVPSNFISIIWLSMHGYGRYHDEITGIKNSFKDLQDAIIKCADKYNLGVWCVVTKSNAGSIKKLVEFCSQNGVKRFCATNISSIGLGKKYIEENGILTVEEFDKLLNPIKETFGDKIQIMAKGYDEDAQCIIVESNGDVVASPYSKSDENLKIVGNILKETTIEVFEKFKSEKSLWEGYINRLKESSLFKD